MIQMTLLATLLKYQFVEKLYPATVAGLEYSCYAADMGLVLKVCANRSQFLGNLIKTIVLNITICEKKTLLFQVEGFNQKLHLIVDVFSKCLKSLADDMTEKQFDVFVQQQFKTYENIFIRPKVLAKELRLNIVESHHQPLFEKNKRLAAITFADFQQFCRKYCEQVRIKAIMQGNITEDRAINIMRNVLNELNCGKVEDVSKSRIHFYIFISRCLISDQNLCACVYVVFHSCLRLNYEQLNYLLERITCAVGHST